MKGCRPPNGKGNRHAPAPCTPECHQTAQDAPSATPRHVVGRGVAGGPLCGCTARFRGQRLRHAARPAWRCLGDKLGVHVRTLCRLHQQIQQLVSTMRCLPAAPRASFRAQCKMPNPARTLADQLLTRDSVPMRARRALWAGSGGRLRAGAGCKLAEAGPRLVQAGTWRA